MTNVSPATVSDTVPYEHRSELRVRYAETDQMGVVYHANYLVWCEIGRTDFIRALGQSYASMEDAGVKLAVTEATLRCIGSARYDDRIAVYTSLTELKSRSLRFAYRIVHADTGRALVTASTALVALDGHGKPIRIPDAVRTMLEQAVAPA
jgi:acyl-CoA thioester hydrolase